jgi:hypothetical protein
MARKSTILLEAEKLRDLIADAVIGFEAQHPGYRVVLLQEYVTDETPQRAKLGQLVVEVVATDGSHKATDNRQLNRST